MILFVLRLRFSFKAVLALDTVPKVSLTACADVATSAMSRTQLEAIVTVCGVAGTA